MAIATKALSPVVVPVNGQEKTEFAINFSSADASGGETILAAGGANTQHAIKSIMINAAADELVTIRDGTTTILGPFQLLADGQHHIDVILGNPIVITANAAITIIAGGAANIAGVIEGFTTKA